MRREEIKQLRFQMKRIRLIEEEIARRYPEGKMRCPTHLSVGQEAVAAAVGMALRENDLAVSGHRAHAHYLGKGGNLNQMLLEIYGKEGGCSAGKGGSMHLIDEKVGFMGSTAIVGGTIPVGVGLALGMHLKETDQVSCILHGDAVLETGVFFESVNFAVLKKLPVLFICENNLYSVYTPLSERQPANRTIVDMTKGLGMESASYDGNDGLLVYEKVSEALDKIRTGSGPIFLEFSTYRWLEHCGPFYDNDLGYRTEAEFEEWKTTEPVARLETSMVEQGICTEQQLQSQNQLIQAEINEAFLHAEKAAFPEGVEAFRDLYHDASPERPF